MRSDPDSPLPWSAPAAPPVAVRMQVPQTTPFWTYAILAVNLLVFASSWLLGREYVLALGAKVNQAIVDGQIWRLVTSMFLHVDVLHIAFNSYALTVFGPQVERPYGRLRFLVMYLLSGLAGSALSFLLSPRPSVGASGAIFGLIGVMGAYLFRYRDRLVAGRARLGNILSVVGYNLIYGFIAVEVDNWAHIGGLLGGLALGWFLAPRYQVVQPNPMDPPQLEDRVSAAHWLRGIALVGLAIGVVIAGGFVRWGS
jgi:rhomboid protease GluP